MIDRTAALILSIILGWGTVQTSAGESQIHQAAQKPVFYAHKYAPPHVSPEWRSFYESFHPFWEIPESHDLNGWRELDLRKQAAFIERDKSLPAEYGVELKEQNMNGVRVVVITPRALQHNEKALVYLHGGGWSSHSPESTWIDTVPMADALGIKVYAVDYKKAPEATLYDIIEQSLAVFQHLVKRRGYRPENLGIYGCSAGGHLSMAVSNALRNRGMGIPGAAVASSPMIDFTLTNDTWITLEGHDPIVSREAYVRRLLPILGIENYRDPLISPQYDENLSSGMPPTLIQTGGKEVLLGDSLVMFQALEAAGQIAKLDVYDGMPHCFPFILPKSREATVAHAKQVAWFREHLALN